MAARKAVIIVICMIVLSSTIMASFVTLTRPSYAVPTPTDQATTPGAPANAPSSISTSPGNDTQSAQPPVVTDQQPGQQATDPQSPSLEGTPTVKIITPEIRARQEQAKKIKERIEDLGRQIGVITEAYNGASLELTKTTEQLNEVSNRLRWFESELQAQKEQINQRVVQIYKHGNADPLEVIVNSTSFRDFLVRFNMLVRIGSNDVNLLERIHLQKRRIEEAKAELERLRSKQVAFTVNLQNKKAEVLNKIKEYEALLAGVDAETRALLNEEAAREAGEQAGLRVRFQGANVKPGSVVAVAMQYLGIPYVWGGETPQGGFDCSGLTRYVYLQFGIDMPHWVPYQWEMGAPVAPGNEQPGDLVFFNNLNHVGIYIGDGYFIEAPRTGDYVKISELAKRKDYMGAKRFILDVPAGR
ncbi:MAG: NlpC/P60 family protein [Actinobacteria bacterium]|nr:NlpC/P60 family protein [Actinomycetota bacterium]